MKIVSIISRTVVVLALLVYASCTPKAKLEETAVTSLDSGSVSAASFGVTAEGQEVMLYTLKNRHGLKMTLMNYGGIILSLQVPDKDGVAEDVVLGYDSLKEYIKSSPYFGAVVGRYGNRIANGKFILDGREYILATNDGKNHLHGGIKGFDKVYWNIEVLSDRESPSLKLSYISKDMEEGYPGTLNVEVVYTLDEDNRLVIDYRATTDRKTILNLTQHTYFNLTGNTKRDILGHKLMLAADKFLPVDKTLIPTGNARAVAGTPFDFRTLTTIGSRINSNDEQIKVGKGYDHAWIFTNSADSLKRGGVLYDPQSGRNMEFFTTQPSVQFYTGNFLDGTLSGKHGVVYKKHYGLCLETQHFPDSPNHAGFPSVVLDTGKVYHNVTAYQFSVR